MKYIEKVLGDSAEEHAKLLAKQKKEGRSSVVKNAGGVLETMFFFSSFFFFIHGRMLSMMWKKVRYWVQCFFGGGQAGFVYFSLGLAGKWQSPRIVFFVFTGGWVPEFVKETHPPKKTGCTKGKRLESFSFFQWEIWRLPFTSCRTPCTSKTPYLNFSHVLPTTWQLAAVHGWIFARTWKNTSKASWITNETLTIIVRNWRRNRRFLFWGSDSALVTAERQYSIAAVYSILCWDG